jgi:hypothetical protein
LITLDALELGQVAPFASAGLALSAYFVSKGKGGLGALAAACAMVEPHVALPACLALFLWLPRTRVTLALAALGCLALSFFLVGPSVAFEYLRDVLPSHALSEVSNHQQLSTTYVLHRVGVSSAQAVRLGEFWYAVMLLLGVAVAGRFARRMPELVPSLPAAFAVFGGAHIHAVQLSAALPAALILLADARTESLRRPLAIAVILLALPFIQFTSLGPGSILLYGAVTVILVSTLLKTPLFPSLAYAVLAGAVPFGLWMVHVPAQPPLTPLISAYDPRALADVSWARYMNLISSANTVELDVVKLPTWFGLATILTIAIACCFPSASAVANRKPAIEDEFAARRLRA